jgi:hypothetical protein
VEGFYHIAPRSQGVPSTLSKFLTGKPAGGTSVINPATGLADANFSDLDARRRDLSALLGAPELVTPMPLDALDVANLVKEAIEVREARTHRVH